MQDPDPKPVISSQLLFRVKKHEVETDFKKLLNGRCFIRFAGRQDTVWIKLDKNFAQVINDNNIKVRIASNEPVTEVVLVPTNRGEI